MYNKCFGIFGHNNSYLRRYSLIMFGTMFMDLESAWVFWHSFTVSFNVICFLIFSISVIRRIALFFEGVVFVMSCEIQLSNKSWRGSSKHDVIAFRRSQRSTRIIFLSVVSVLSYSVFDVTKILGDASSVLRS